MEIFVILGIVGAAIIIIGNWLKAKGQATEKRLGISADNIGFADVGVDVPIKADPEKKIIRNLFSEKYRLAGKPDYLLLGDNNCIPVEIKSSVVSDPRESDVLQLLTYCLLAEENGYKVSFGRLEYQNRIFDIPYGPEERKEVIDILAKIRNTERLNLDQVPQVNDNRCWGCKYRTICQ